MSQRCGRSPLNYELATAWAMGRTSVFKEVIKKLRELIDGHPTLEFITKDDLKEFIADLKGGSVGKNEFGGRSVAEIPEGKKEAEK